MSETSDQNIRPPGSPSSSNQSSMRALSGLAGATARKVEDYGGPFRTKLTVIARTPLMLGTRMDAKQ